MRISEPCSEPPLFHLLLLCVYVASSSFRSVSYESPVPVSASFFASWVLKVSLDFFFFILQSFIIAFFFRAKWIVLAVYDSFEKILNRASGWHQGVSSALVPRCTQKIAAKTFAVNLTSENTAIVLKNFHEIFAPNWKKKKIASYRLVNHSCYEVNV